MVGRKICPKPRIPGADAPRIERIRASALRLNPHNARTHSKRQIEQIAASMRKFGVINPIVANDRNEVLAGHARLAAVKLIGVKHVPVIRVSHLSEPEMRAYMLADNKLAANAGWDRSQLAIEFQELQITLPEVSLDLDITGFEAAEIDLLLGDMASSRIDPSNEVPPLPVRAVTQPRDLWRLGKHRLLSGDARKIEALERVMDGKRAAAVFCDPPYNLRMRSIGGRGRIRHPDFAVASGEMDRAQFQEFLSTTLSNAARFSCEGAVHFVCMDWRHVSDLIEASHRVYSEMLNLVVWNKSNAGQGSFYRSQHELIGVFRVGSFQHRNNIELGRYGRNRSNVWNYTGVNTFGRERLEQLAMHPTVKPVAMVADALLDCTVRGDVVLDHFGGSGTLILAAEKVGRYAHVIEIDPRYVDVAIARWQAETKLQAILDGDGRTFEAISKTRRQSRKTASPDRTIMSGQSSGNHGEVPRRHRKVNATGGRRG